jgi:hypothetical protein
MLGLPVLQFFHYVSSSPGHDGVDEAFSLVVCAQLAQLHEQGEKHGVEIAFQNAFIVQRIDDEVRKRFSGLEAVGKLEWVSPSFILPQMRSRCLDLQ